MTSPAGIDAAALDGWIDGHVDEVSTPVQWHAIPGGRSNLTFVGTDAAGAQWVLRRPPLGHLLDSAHDVLREQRIMRALAPTAVPVPRIVASSADVDVIGAPFFVMTYVDGVVCRTPESAAAVPRSLRAAAGPALVDSLAALHAVDFAAIGLGDLGRGEDYAARQIRRWRRQVEQSSRRDLPALFDLADQLAARVPLQTETTIVHGDFRLDNCLLADDGGVAAVLDWELATLGDPRSDVGLLLAYWAEPSDVVCALQHPPTVVEGFSARQDLQDRYVAQSGRDLADIDFWVALAFWKLACIVEGVYTRLLEGAMGDAGTDPTPFGVQTLRLIELADARISGRRPSKNEERT